MARSLPRGEQISGSWQDVGANDFIMAFERGRILLADQGRLQTVFTILESTDEGLKACRDGRDVMLQVKSAGELLLFLDPATERLHKLRKLEGRPGSLALAMPIPPARPLSADRILAIQREVRLHEQSEHSQVLKKPPGAAQEFPWLDENPGEGGQPQALDLAAIEKASANARFIRDLVREVGWIDVQRFGYPTSKAAFLLVQHTWDPSLMLAVLPYLKRDVDTGLMDASSYALLFDRSHLATGRLQRYGSQVARNKDGELIVLPLEEPDKVDERRLQLGLSSLKDYVGLFGAPAVKISAECRPLLQLRTKSRKDSKDNKGR